MKDLWQRLETHLKKHAPAALDFLNPPASKDEIRLAETELGIRFPADFVASLRIHNGQIQSHHSISFVPNEYEAGGIYRAPFGELAPLSWIVSQTLWIREAIDDCLRGLASGFEYEGPVRRDGNWSWIIFSDAGGGDKLGLDLQPDTGGKDGQVISILHDPSSLLVLAPSYRAWFQDLVSRHESGRYYFKELDGVLDAVDRFRPKSHGPDGLDDVDEGNILRFPK